MKAKKKKNLLLIDKIFLTLNCLAAVALLLSYMAPGLDPRETWIIAALGLGYPILLYTNLALVVFWLFRKPVFALISTACILLGYNALTVTYGFRTQTPLGERLSENIRLMEYNVHGFKGIDKYEGNTIHKPTLEIIERRQPDIIAFEEYITHSSDTIPMTNAVIRTSKSKNYFFKPYAILKKDSAGIAIFSKLPIIDTGSVPAPKLLQVWAIYVDLKYKGSIFRVYSVHLTSTKMNEKAYTRYLNGNFNLGSSSFIIGKLSSAFTFRSHQVAYIKRHLDKCPYPYIITGDFNDTPLSFAVNELGYGLKNAFAEKGSGFGITYYNKFPPLQIDYVFADPKFDIVNYEIIQKKISDHYPIVCDLKFNN